MILALIIYDRLHNIEAWARCKPATPVYVIHTGRDRDRCREICDAAGFTYVSRENIGLDIGALQDVFQERLEGFPNDWDRLLWITDDVIPVNPNWLEPFESSTADLAAFQVSLSPVRHVRTVAYCITKELSRQITFPADPVTTKDHGYYFEYRGGEDTLTAQAEALGATIEQVSPTGLWDQGYGKRPERLHEHLSNFGGPAVVDVYIERKWPHKLNPAFAYNVHAGYPVQRIREWLDTQRVLYHINTKYMTKVFTHSGATGDIIFSLPTIKAMGGGHLCITPGNEVMRQRAEAVKPLLEVQDYITGVSIVKYKPAGSIDLDKFRKYAGHHNNLVEAHFKGQGLKPSRWQDGWLTVPESPSPGGMYAVINVTTNYADPNFDWKAEVDYLFTIADDVVMVGYESEWKALNDDRVKFYDCDFLGAACFIRDAVMFTGCYSAMSTIAMGLGIPHRLVQAPGHTCSSLLEERETIVNL